MLLLLANWKPKIVTSMSVIWHFVANIILEESSFCWDSGVEDLYWWYICHDHQPPSFSPTWWGDIGVMFHVFQINIFVCWLVFVFVCKSRFRNSLKRPKLVSAPGRPSVLQRHKLIGKIASLFFQLSGNIDIMISASMYVRQSLLILQAVPKSSIVLSKKYLPRFWPFATVCTSQL